MDILSAQVSEPVFSFCVYDAGRGGREHGELLLGGVDEERYEGEVTWLLVTQKMYWQVRMDALRVSDGDVACLGGSEVIADTRTSMAMIPFDDAHRINTRLGAKKSSRGGYTFNCSALNALPDVALVFGGRSFVMTPEDYVMTIKRRGSTTTCKSALWGSYDQEWIIGNKFLAKYYNIFDIGNHRIGLATLHD